MKKNSFFRVMMAIALMLAIGLNADAQLGKKILQRAKNSAETKAQMEADRAVHGTLDKAADAIKNPKKGEKNKGSSDNTGASGNNGSPGGNETSSGNESASSQTASGQQGSSGTKLKPSEKAIAADPKASDETIESGFTRSLSEIRARYEQLPDKVYYKPYYADECKYFYALGEEQEKVFQTELSYVEKTYQAARKFAHIKIIQPISYRNYIKVKIPAYRENPEREGYAVIGQHVVYAYFAQFAADPEGFYPYLNFVSARVAHTALSFFKVAEWVNLNGEQCECAITLEDGSKAQLVESFQGWRLKMNEEFYRLNKILNEQTPFNTIGKAGVGVLQQMKKAESDNNLPVLRMYFHRYETIMDDFMNHPKKVEDESYFMLVREYNAYKEKYEGWAAATKPAKPAINMPKTYDKGADLAAKALETAKKEFGNQFTVDKVVFLSNDWQEFKEQKYPYRVMHRSLRAGLMTKEGDKWVIRQYNFQQHSDGHGGWKQVYQFSAGFDDLYEPRPVNNYKP